MLSIYKQILPPRMFSPQTAAPRGLRVHTRNVLNIILWQHTFSFNIVTLSTSRAEDWRVRKTISFEKTTLFFLSCLKIMTYKNVDWHIKLNFDVSNISTKRSEYKSDPFSPLIFYENNFRQRIVVFSSNLVKTVKSTLYKLYAWKLFCLLFFSQSNI